MYIMYKNFLSPGTNFPIEWYILNLEEAGKTILKEFKIYGWRKEGGIQCVVLGKEKLLLKGQMETF